MVAHIFPTAEIYGYNLRTMLSIIWFIGILGLALFIIMVLAIIFKIYLKKKIIRRKKELPVD